MSAAKVDRLIAGAHSRWLWHAAKILESILDWHVSSGIRPIKVLSCVRSVHATFLIEEG